jgi:hypothetical protein
MFLAAAALQGCGGQQSEKQTREEFYKNNPEIASARQDLAKFSGRVSVDGHPPDEGVALFLVLNDPDHPEKKISLRTKCDQDGSFAFKTYESGDGVPLGKYVVAFAGLHPSASRGRSFTRRFVGPDALSNLYNDPDMNKGNPDFIVNVQPPGRTDYEFNLTVTGKQPVATPGKNAVTQITGA